MDGQKSSEALTIEALAAQMFGESGTQAPVEQAPETDSVDNDNSETQQQLPPAGHPAWQEILDAIPAEYHDKVTPTLQNWDAGVSRRFQKIHDEYEPYKQFADYDPSAIEEAVKIYESLNSDPNATWEAIGRAYGLSPEQVSQAESSLEEDDYDLSDLPPALRAKLERLDLHEQVLETITQRMLSQQEIEEQAQEDAALEELMGELKEAHGNFDEDYVVGLMAAGVDPDEAVTRYKGMVSRFGLAEPRATTPPAQASPPVEVPRVMSSGGGVAGLGDQDVTKMDNRQTKDLVAELLRLSQSQ